MATESRCSLTAGARSFVVEALTTAFVQMSQ
jgi:hypothetical protein